MRCVRMVVLAAVVRSDRVDRVRKDVLAEDLAEQVQVRAGGATPRSAPPKPTDREVPAEPDSGSSDDAPLFEEDVDATERWYRPGGKPNQGDLRSESEKVQEAYVDPERVARAKHLGRDLDWAETADTRNVDPCGRGGWRRELGDCPPEPEPEPVVQTAAAPEKKEEGWSMWLIIGGSVLGVMALAGFGFACFSKRSGGRAAPAGPPGPPGPGAQTPYARGPPQAPPQMPPGQPQGHQGMAVMSTAGVPVPMDLAQAGVGSFKPAGGPAAQGPPQPGQLVNAYGQAVPQPGQSPAYAAWSARA